MTPQGKKIAKEYKYQVLAFAFIILVSMTVGPVRDVSSDELELDSAAFKASILCFFACLLLI